MTSWDSVINNVAEIAEVFTYNRAGFSGRKSKNTARNAEAIVNELRELLKNVDLKPPNVLVGHSAGGAYMELYAKTYTDDAAGVVLVDPSSSNYPARCKSEKLNYCVLPSRMPAREVVSGG